MAKKEDRMTVSQALLNSTRVLHHQAEHLHRLVAEKSTLLVENARCLKRTKNIMDYQFKIFLSHKEIS